ncbi:MAG: polyprenyl synthetase family protein [Acidobacteriota bacterium]|nr:polyprenyl synthetase family protein [Acidobacteriota bacterium]
MLGNRLTRGAFERSLEASGRLPDCGEPVAAIVLASAFALQVVDDVLDGNDLNTDSPARAGWLAAGAVGCVAESVAALPLSETQSRAILRAVAQSIGCIATMQEQNAPRRAERGERCAEWIARIASGDDSIQPPFANVEMPPLFAEMREKVARSSPSAFCEWARDAADAFGDAGAARKTFSTLAAVIEGIKIIDDIQDGESHCVAVDVGEGRALNLALGALALALELTSDLPFPEESWRAATASIGRGIRETAIGQDLETGATGDFAMFWEIVDRKTSPLVATAFEIGALAAGAAPAHAAALTQLAVPFGRLLQIGDDCNDALGPGATDWRTPRLNLLMLYALSGPRGGELDALLQRGHDAEALREAQHWLLRDGALAYAIHAQLTVIATATETMQRLAIPNPDPFLRSLEQSRAECELLMSKSGVDADLAASVARV